MSDKKVQKEQLCPECRRREVIEYLNSIFAKLNSPQFADIPLLHLNGVDVFGLDRQ